MILFNPFPLRNRGEIRTLHHVKELLSFYSAGSFLYEKAPRFFNDSYLLFQRRLSYFTKTLVFFFKDGCHFLQTAIKKTIPHLGKIVYNLGINT